MKALLVFPNQLFVNEELNTVIIFIEDNHFFDDGIPYHKHKLMLHRASMKFHYDQFKCQKVYLEYPVTDIQIKQTLAQYEQVFAYDVVNHALKSKYTQFSVTWLESPNFLTSEDTIKQYYKNKKRYFMHDFYKFQRHRLNILIENGKPLLGKYSFDEENRKKIPPHLKIPKSLDFSKHAYLEDAKNWVNQMFSHRPGNTDDFNFPITRSDALKQLAFFIEEKHQYFGPYQDAISNIDPLLFHSNLSSSLNIGLLSPLEIVEAALESDAPISSKEGFIRQIIGWREFMRAIYLLEGEKMRNMNALGHHNLLSNHFYKGQTEIPIVDQTIAKFTKYAYLHHIERLMVLGNLMLLINAHPHEVYRYFMAMSIDAYDWVMVPNVYGMSQFASSTLMTTKPYFSSSNYLKKMGVIDGSWTKIWDALFYMFLRDQRTLIENNPRLGVLIKNLDKKDADALKAYEHIKLSFLKIVIKETK